MANNGDRRAPMGNEQIRTDIITLTRFLTEEQTKHKEATGDFTFVMTRLIAMTSFEADACAIGYYATLCRLRSSQSHTIFVARR